MLGLMNMRTYKHAEQRMIADTSCAGEEQSTHGEGVPLPFLLIEVF
jgi:hypothetical protein